MGLWRGARDALDGEANGIIANNTTSNELDSTLIKFRMQSRVSNVVAL